MLKLTIEDDEGKTTVVPLIRDEITIGRQEGNTIRLTERNISRRHARLTRANGTVFIEDLASYTGVKVNGARIVTATPVAEGDEVFIGDYKLMLRMDRPQVQINPDRATMPAMPAALMPPMNAVGGSIAIPTRGTPAAMAAAAAAQAAVPAPISGAPTAPNPPAPPTVTQQRVSAPTVPAQRASVPAVPVTRADSAAPEVLDAQPTIPVRALEGDVDREVAARLVVLTTELAGREFSLSRASIVIGRTDENDFVLNHRSISRHHAKIVREGGRYTIVDLQSANGVRVNKEDYERIDLKAGDIVELGHVKIRFVGAHETYTYDPNARPDRPAFPLKLAAAGAAAVVVAGVVAFALRGGHPAEAPQAPQAAAASATTGATPPPAPAAAATPASIIADATTAMSADDWTGAGALLAKLPATIGDASLDRQAADLRQRVATEVPASAIYAQFGAMADSKRYADALAKYGQIPSDSVYKVRGRSRADEARTLLVAERLAFADQAREAGRCAEVKEAVAEVEQLDPTNQLGKSIVRLCRPQAAAVAAKPARPAARTVAVTARTAERERPAEKEAAEPAPAKREEPEEAAPVDPDALMKQAREAWLKQQCGSAIDLSRKALKAKPGMADAYQIIAVCSCSLKDAEGATRAYAKLDEKNRNLVHALCQKNGIIVGSE
ncbi:MAG TPA: FHA domain-containing protein [Polyangia bacterium]|nr:FHA domain-containing protein [Polyangia bacterium]